MASDNAPKKAKTARKPKAKPIPPEAYESSQLALFQGYLVNTEAGRDSLSHMMHLWDSVPRYSLPRKVQEKWKRDDEFPHVRQISFTYLKQPITAVILPARLPKYDANGNITGEVVQWYPSSREELIEHALRRLATQKQMGFYDEAENRSGLCFTLHQLRKELIAHGHSMTAAEIAEGLDVLNLSSIEFSPQGEDKNNVARFGRVQFLPSLHGVKRKDLEKSPDAKWFAEFNPYVTANIAELKYRQFNYDRLMNCRTQLSRWVLGDLVLKFTFAAVTESFTLRFSTVKRESGLLDRYTAERQAVAELDETMEEMKTLGALMHIKREETRGPRNKLLDVAYTVIPTRAFAIEQKAANRRLQEAKGIRRAGGAAQLMPDLEPIGNEC